MKFARSVLLMLISIFFLACAVHMQKKTSISALNDAVVYNKNGLISEREIIPIRAEYGNRIICRSFASQEEVQVTWYINGAAKMTDSVYEFDAISSCVIEAIAMHPDGKKEERKWDLEVNTKKR